ncbi:hypothetical protein Q3304_19850 [Clostridioides sp. GD02377]|uniref:hypothetical protein n=1 Tax=unclassified Clostridioides TaxID=2635829 RepID=UPI0038AABD00
MNFKSLSAGVIPMPGISENSAVAIIFSSATNSTHKYFQIPYIHHPLIISLEVSTNTS